MWRAALLLAIILAAGGCASPYAADRLAATGGLAGAGIGAGIGAASGEPVAGAAIGTAIGAVTGAAVGSEIDAAAQNRALIEQQIGRPLTGAVQIGDVITMTHAGLGDEVIITHIQSAGLARPVEVNDLIVLKQNGVSDVVINVMQRPPAPAVVSSPAPPPAVIVHEHWSPRPPIYASPCYGRRHCPPRRRPGVSWGVSFHNH